MLITPSFLPPVAIITRNPGRSTARSAIPYARIWIRNRQRAGTKMRNYGAEVNLWGDAPIPKILTSGPEDASSSSIDFSFASIRSFSAEGSWCLTDGTYAQTGQGKSIGSLIGKRASQQPGQTRHLIRLAFPQSGHFSTQSIYSPLQLGQRFTIWSCFFLFVSLMKSLSN